LPVSGSFVVTPQTPPFMVSPEAFPALIDHIPQFWPPQLLSILPILLDGVI
jgi:hypothetical protein